MPLEIGTRAPGFTLRDQHGQTVTLAELGGACGGQDGVLKPADRAVLLVFYPFAFSGVCTGELTGFRDRLGDFETGHSTMAAISCDPMFSQRAFADRDALFFPLLSDYWPHGEVATAYDVFDRAHGCPTRSSYVVGRDGRISWAVHSPAGQARDLDEQALRLRDAARLDEVV